MLNRSLRISIAAVSITLLVALAFSFSYPRFSYSATPGNFSSADSAINSAFVATYSAGQAGGNVTTLVEKLNQAVALVQKAQAENNSNPPQASLDLQNATLLANQVLAQAPLIQAAGNSATQLQTEESIGASIAIIAVAVLIYIYGGQIYRSAWFYIYKNYTVRRTQKNG